MKVSLILGIYGQDDSLLAKEFLESGRYVWGGFRRRSMVETLLKTWRSRFYIFDNKCASILQSIHDAWKS